MRILAALALLGCGHGKSPAVDAASDGPAGGGDVQLQFCTASAGTANVMVSDGGSATTFTRLDAGAVWLVGPAKGGDLAGAPMSLSLLVTNTDPLETNQAMCCAASDAACCPATGLVVRSDAIAAGAEVGMHPVTLQAFSGSATLPGTLTITSFQHPFESAPGRIAGSVSAITNTRTVSGSFDNTFCAALLTATI